jgi:hypothetical protein
MWKTLPEEALTMAVDGVEPNMIREAMKRAGLF